MEYRFSDRVSSLKPSAIGEIFKYAADPSVVSLSAGNRRARCISLKGDCGNLGKGFCRRSDFGFTVQCFGGLHSAEKAPYGIYEKGA